MSWIKADDLKRDKLLWEDIVTINVNENVTHKINEEYSTHIVRLYENKYNEKYFLFIQPKSCEENFYSNERCNEWLEPISTYSSWGKFIMNYSKPHYRSLRKILKFDDMPIYCVYGADLNNLQDSLLKENILIVSERYRQ